MFFLVQFSITLLSQCCVYDLVWCSPKKHLVKGKGKDHVLVLNTSFFAKNTAADGLTPH